MSNRKENIPLTRVYLNAGGISIRVIDFITGYNNPDINLYVQETDDDFNYDIDYENFSPFFIEIKNQPQYEIDKFMYQLALVYPTEVKYNYTPDKQEKKKAVTKKK